jgi:hypothetical protein
MNALKEGQCCKQYKHWDNCQYYGFAQFSSRRILKGLKKDGRSIPFRAFEASFRSILRFSLEARLPPLEVEAVAEF